MSNIDLSDIPEEIAVIGMAGRFPKARNIREFWRNLRDGVEGISFFSDEELLDAGIKPSTLRNPNYVKARMMLDDVEMFDASFFGFTPREAETTDPQHRLFLECAWEALEDAGYDPARYPGLIGVYAGVSMNTYLFNLYSNRAVIEATGGFQVAIGNDKDHLPTSVSYKLNLRGPSVAVQTACSTSLVAVHLACQALLNGECDMALAGGASVVVPQRTGYLYEEGGIDSPDGRCRPFDSHAAGTTGGSGVAIVLLKRLSDALSDGDRIDAVITGSAINNDGSLKVGYTAPSVSGQSQVISLAQAVAAAAPESISYIEAHGTATPLGDPIEVAALSEVFRASTTKRNFCALGSVKSNIGHLDTAAGVAGLIKTVLALKHREIPPTLHFREANPRLGLEETPFYVNRELEAWELREGQDRRRAGVSSFGIGGTNAHVVLEEAPEREQSGASRPWQLLVLSAKTSGSLERATEKLAEHLRQQQQQQERQDGAQPADKLADIAYTLQVGRQAMAYRRAVLCREVGEAIRLLESSVEASQGENTGAAVRGRVWSGSGQGHAPRVVFMFSGQATQYVQMGRGLYEREPQYRSAVDECAEQLKAHLGLDLRRVLYPERGEEARAEEQLSETWLTQPALFVVEYALARQWMRWGVRPQALIGHSVGEYVAACVSGVLELEEALRVVSLRARLMQETERGAMLAVGLGEEQLERRLTEQEQLAKQEKGEGEGEREGGKLWVAAVNGRQSCVVSGSEAAIEQLEERLRAEGVGSRRLHSGRAFHSGLMDEAVAPLVEEMRKVRLREPEVPYISNVTGGWISAEEAQSAEYWGRQMRERVRFGEGIEEVLRGVGGAGAAVLLEVGPGGTLTRLAEQQIRRQEREGAAKGEAGGEQRSGRVVAVQSLRGREEEAEDEERMVEALGQMYVSGVEVEWERYYEGERRVRVALPTYQFERQRFWVEASKGVGGGVGSRGRTAGSNGTKDEGVEKQGVGEVKRADLARWLYLPTWKRSRLTVHDHEERLLGRKINWLVFVDESGFGEAFVKQLREAGQMVSSVNAGNIFEKLGESVYSINARQKKDYERLLQELEATGRTPERVVHLWGVTENEAPGSSDERFKKAQERGFYSLLYLAQSLIDRNVAADLEIAMVTSNMQAVTGVEALQPEKATVLGACKVIPQEHINLRCRSIDVDSSKSGTWQEEKLVKQLVAELAGDTGDPVVAYRGGHRWVQGFEPVRLEDRNKRRARVREEGVYLMTGGLGKVGSVLAKHLAKTVRAKLILTGRTELPAREEWETWLASHHETERVSEKIRKVKALEEMGAQVMVAAADVGDEDQMRQVVAAATERFGSIHGVIYAAGLVGMSSFRLVQEIERAECEQHFQAKAHGLYVLERVLEGRELDFCLLFSSISSVLGGLGFVAYAAANSFMDNFAFTHNQAHPLPWTSVDWDGWQVEEEGPGGDAVASPAEFALTATEGVKVIQQILSTDAMTQAVVSTSDLQARINQWVNFESLRSQAGVKRVKQPLSHARPDLSSTFEAPAGQLEQEVAKVWEELLGVSQIGARDNFFEMGGDSLIATQLVSRLRKKFQSPLSLRNFYETPTIAGLAGIIEKLRAEGAQNQDLAIVPVSRDGRRMKRSSEGRLTETQGDAKTAAPQGSWPQVTGQKSDISPRPDSLTPGDDETPARKDMEFSLFFFSTDELKAAENKYRLLIESARFADTHGLAAVWTPERHFHAFGGLYPNPAVTSTALAMVTKRVQIRAGSIVLPLQNPVRVAEEWAVIDNLSQGRVGVSFASGWHSNDFVLSPENYAQRRQVMYDRIEIVQRLWRGETIKLPNAAGHEIEVRIYPRPVQPRLPIWLTANGTQTFVKAGEMGAHVLTSLLSQDLETLAENIKLYRRALARHGHSPADGQVALMLHTYIGDDLDAIKAKAKMEYSSYLRTNLELQANHGKGLGMDVNMQDYTEGDIETIISNKFEHLFRTDGLIGTPQTCLKTVERLKAIGVDEVACLIDFVLDVDALLEGLEYIEQLKQLSNEPVLSGARSRLELSN